MTPDPALVRRPSRRPSIPLRTLCSGVASVILLAACGGESNSGAPPTGLPPVVVDSANLRLLDAQFTQAVQNTTGTLPLVEGMPVTVNVLVTRARASTSLRAPVVLTLRRGTTLVRRDTAFTSGSLTPSASLAAPQVQFLIPGSQVTGALTWELELDPGATVPDSTRTDNRLPASGVGALNVVPLPGLSVRFVPIVLSSHGNATGNVSAANLDEYLQTVRSVLPTGPLSAEVGPPVIVSRSFGSPPNGGAPEFWLGALQDLDIARVASATPSTHWYGVVAPPSGFNFVINGGYAYVPGTPTAAGAATRTALGVQVGWFNRPTQARDLVAHELAHNFGRTHAPACGATGTDPGFPQPDGTIGIVGHDVASWASLRTNGAAPVAASAGDVMGYCFPVWVSPYTWEAVRTWRRATAPVALRVDPVSGDSDAPRVPALVIAGRVPPSGDVIVQPPLELPARVPSVRTDADITVELLAADGSVRATARATSAPVDHVPGERHFIALFPADAGRGPVDVRVRTSGGRSGHWRDPLARQLISPLSADTAAQIIARRRADGRTELTSVRGRPFTVRDPDSGSLIGIAWDGRLTVPARQAYVVAVNVGVRSVTRTIVPR
ncbi:MAG: hypothetical protein SFW08_07030 [Gemmatimonadaceae bacterium]|nr:hypothetical protein [Gemmatimonadaceae bacterium]